MDMPVENEHLTGQKVISPLNAKNKELLEVKRLTDGMSE